MEENTRNQQEEKNKESEPDLFKSLSPELMKSTKMLILDHDVTRYHSYDMLRYLLYLDTKDRVNGLKHFSSIKPRYARFLKVAANGEDLTEQIYFMKTTVHEFNVFDCFNMSLDINTVEDYTARLQQMASSKDAMISSTDVGRLFSPVFDKKDITGYMLRYKNEKYIPNWYDKVTTYQAVNIFDFDLITRIIEKHNINAVMVSCSEIAIRIAYSIIKAGITRPMTFIIARYCYNYAIENGERIYPLFSKEMGILELKYKYEFGYFDSYSGISAKYNYLRRMEEQYEHSATNTETGKTPDSE